jgi:PIN domain nuclease of toxin-antitoxin system
VSDPAALLLDTNVLIWTVSASEKISARARRAMSRPAASLVVSVVSVWEIVLKHHAGKLHFQASLEEVVVQILQHSAWTVLPLLPECLPVLAGLPMLHKDPFDRLLVAQARLGSLVIVTADEQIKKYDVGTIW